MRYRDIGFVSNIYLALHVKYHIKIFHGRAAWALGSIACATLSLPLRYSNASNVPLLLPASYHIVTIARITSYTKLPQRCAYMSRPIKYLPIFGFGESRRNIITASLHEYVS